MSGKTATGTGKTGLLDWAKTAKTQHGPACSTCAWLAQKRVAHDPIVEELEELLRQICSGKISLPLAVVARKLSADHGYGPGARTFATHVARCRPDLKQPRE